MQNKAFIILESVEPLSREQGCVYIENTVLGMVLIINLFNFNQGANYKLVLTDADGHTSINSFSENYTMVKVIDAFDLNGSIYAEVFKDGDISLKGFYNSVKTQITSVEPLNLIKNNNTNTKDDQSQSVDKNSKTHLSAMEWAIENSEKDIYDEAMSFVNRLNLGLIKPQKPNILQNSETSIGKNEEKTCNFENVSTFSLNTLKSNFNEFNNKIGSVDNTSKLSKITTENESFSQNESHTQNNLIVNEVDENQTQNPRNSIGNNFKNCFNLSKEFFKRDENENGITYWDTIKDDFELLFNSGDEYSPLEKFFGGQWMRVRDDETIILGKLHTGSNDNCNSIMPDIVALAVPTIVGKEQFQLGKNANFISLNDYQDFGFMVLMQNSKSGRAIKIMGNKG